VRTPLANRRTTEIPTRLCRYALGLRKIVELVWNPTESWTVWQDSGTAYVINFLLVPNLSLLIDTSLLSKSERPSLFCWSPRLCFPRSGATTEKSSATTLRSMDPKRRNLAYSANTRLHERMRISQEVGTSVVVRIQATAGLAPAINPLD